MGLRKALKALSASLHARAHCGCWMRERDDSPDHATHEVLDEVAFAIEEVLETLRQKKRDKPDSEEE